MKHFKHYVILWFLSCTISVDAVLEVLDLQAGEEKFIKALETTPGPMIAGSFKMNPSLPPDERVLSALRKRSEKGIEAKIITESRLTTEETSKGQKGSAEFSYGKFQETGVHMHDIPQFSNVHVKIISTPTEAFVGTTNCDGQYPHYDARDFIIKITGHPVVDLLFSTMRQFLEGEDVSWEKFNYDLTAMKSDDVLLSWGPFFHKKQIITMINMACETIDIYQQDLQDPEIAQALRDRASQGVVVRIVMSYQPFLEKVANGSLVNLKEIVAAGGYVRLTGKPIAQEKPVHVHAKVLIVDNKIMYLGSANFYPNVMDPEQNNLNVGIITNQHAGIAYVEDLFNKDWDLHEKYALQGGGITYPRWPHNKKSVLCHAITLP